MGVLIRGLRHTTEYEYELRLATGNLEVGEIPTIGIFPKDMGISSTDVRQLIQFGHSGWKRYVSQNAVEYIERIRSMR